MTTRRRLRPDRGRLADRQSPRTARRRSVVPLGPHRRRDRPARLRQDPRPAHPGPARRTRRSAGHPHQGRRPAAVHHRPHAATTGPRVVLDPFAQADGLPELVWDPIAGCIDPIVAERRAKAFTAGTIKATAASGSGDAAARFYAAEAAKVLQCYFHAAALAGHTLDRLLEWVARPLATHEPAEILLNHPGSAHFWHGLLQGALTGDDRTAGNTITTVQQAMSLFFQPDIRARCVPGTGPARHRHRRRHPRPGHVLPARTRRPLRLRLPADDRAHRTHPRHRARTRQRQPVGTAVPADARLPRRAALHRAAADPAHPDGQRTSPRDLLHLRRPDLAAARLRSSATPTPAPCSGSPTCLIMFGGSKDVAFNKEVSDLVGTTRVARTTWQLGTHRRTLRARRRHAHPPTRGSPPTPREARPRRRREQQTHHRQTHPLHRRQDRPSAARRNSAKSAPPASASDATTPSPPMPGGRGARRRPSRERPAVTGSTGAAVPHAERRPNSARPTATCTWP